MRFQFACDSLRSFWKRIGCHHYPQATSPQNIFLNAELAIREVIKIGGTIQPVVAAF